MSEDKKSLVPITSGALVRVEKSLAITNKILSSRAEELLRD